jgi:sugar lactone lactonase YvrE
LSTQVLKIALLLSVMALVPATGSAPPQPITALAPFEVWAEGFHDLRGIAIDGDGALYVADREMGTVTRLASDHTRTIVAASLERPVGLAFDLSGRLLIAEERAGRVVRLEATDALTVLASGIKQPRWLAVGEHGTLFISARRLTRGADAEPDDESAEPEAILALGAEGRLSLLADGFKSLQGLAAADGALYAATRGRRDDARTDGVIFEIPFAADGRAGEPTPIGPADSFKRPVGVALDRLGGLFLTTRELESLVDRSRRAIAKLHPDGRVTVFASNLEHPQALAFDAAGNLFVADGHAGRVVRFRSPLPATLTALPAFTNRPTIELAGTSEPGARLDVFGAAAPPVSGGSGASGAFSLAVPLAPNAASELQVFATGASGHGLSSAPAEAAIIHDDVVPALAFLLPAGGFLRQTVTVQARATDAGSGVAALAFAAGNQPLVAASAPPAPAPSVTAAAAWSTAALPDGAHTLVATATDRAGNAATVTRVVIVDNTPPETLIIEGPDGVIGQSSVTFAFGASDSLTPADSLQFAWRLDGGAWSPFSAATRVAIADVAAGPRTFEVKARDLAGNEDATPARREFTVGSLRITIQEPGSTMVVSAGMLVVRGIIESGGLEVGVTVNDVPAAVHERAFAALIAVTSTTPRVTARATSTTGVTASDTVPLNVSELAGEPSVLRATPAYGSAPLTVSFRLGGEASTRVELDADGDGRTDVSASRLDGVSFTYTRPGLYVARLTGTDAAGASFTATTVVQVFDRSALDALLQAKWAGVKAALRRGDVPGAVAHIASRTRADYEAAFRAIAARLPTIDAIMTALSLIRVRHGTAVYEMTRADAGIVKAFEVRFAIDADGLWRLEAF